MKILRLNLKREYWEEIRDGRKLVEYRLASKWMKRLEGRVFDAIDLCLGYPKKSETHKTLRRKWNGYTVETITHEHFGSMSVVVFAIDVSEALV